MKDISPELTTDLASTVTTLCQCFELTRKDGTVYRRTTHTRSIKFENHVFTPGGFDPTDISSSFTGQIADVEITSYFDGELTERDVRFGKLDDATGRIVWGNYKAPGHGVMQMFKGIVSGVEINDDRTAVRFTISGRLSTLTSRFGEIRSATCRAAFGDERCKVDIAALKVTCAAVSLVGNVLTVTTDDPPSFEPTDHRYWRIEFSGAPLLIVDVEFRTAVGGAQAATGGTVIASRDDTFSGDPANAFDADVATSWRNNDLGTPWLGYHFAADVTIKEFAIKVKQSSYGPKNVALAYSDDGENWARVQGSLYSSIVWGTLNEQKVFTPATSNTVTPAKAFQFGIVRFEEGDNLGESFSIASYARVGDTITLHLMIRPLFGVIADQEVSVYPGCDLTLERCKFYNNVINMRAEPYTPTDLYQGQNRIIP